MHVRLVLVSTWRSGSSFASELLVSHPGAYLQVNLFWITHPTRQLGALSKRDTDTMAVYHFGL